MSSLTRWTRNRGKLSKGAQIRLHGGTHRVDKIDCFGAHLTPLHKAPPMLPISARAEVDARVAV